MVSLNRVLLALTISGSLACQGSGSQPPVEPKLTLRLFYPSELKQIIEPAVARLNEASLSPQGSGVRVLALAADGASAAARVAAEPPESPMLWLSSASLSHGLLAAAKVPLTLSECRSMATSDIGAAFRSADGFLVEEHENEGLFAQFVAPPTEPDPAKVPLIFAGLPGSASSGLAVYLMASSAAAKVRPQALTAAQVQGDLEALKASQVRLARYFASDSQMLSWTAELRGGQPAVALTTSQQVHAHNVRSPSSPLAFVRAGVPSFSLDYPLCALRHPKLSGAATEAQGAVMQALLSAGIRDQLSAAGFGPPLAQAHDDGAAQPGTARALFDRWQAVRKPSLSAFVVDTSSGVPGEVFASLSRELQAFASRPASAGDSLALVSTSTRPELLAAPSPDHARFREAAGELRGSGALALRDGLGVAMSLVTDAPLAQFRGVIVAVISGQDTASAASAASLAQRSIAAISRRGTALYIVEISNPAQPQQQPSAAAQLASDLGGSHVETGLAGLPGVLRALFQEIE